MLASRQPTVALSDDLCSLVSRSGAYCKPKLCTPLTNHSSLRSLWRPYVANGTLMVTLSFRKEWSARNGKLDNLSYGRRNTSAYEILGPTKGLDTAIFLRERKHIAWAIGGGHRKKPERMSPRLSARRRTGHRWPARVIGLFPQKTQFEIPGKVYARSLAVIHRISCKYVVSAL
jgi:hypothetical protein